MSESESEEEILVYAELEDDVELGQYKNVNVLGINSKTPIIQMDDTFFTGKYENPLGTYMFFKNTMAPTDFDPLFDKISEKNLEYVCKTRKFIKMEHAYITPKENINKQSSGNITQFSNDIETVNFKTFEEGIEKFKGYWKLKSPALEENKEPDNSSTSKS